MIRSLTEDEDYAPEHTPKFITEPSCTTLVLMDLQYASACRTAGLGKRMAEAGKQHLVKWRFDRIEQILLPNVKRLLAYFRQHSLKIIYVTVGSAMADYSDAPPYRKALWEANNNHAGAREHEILDEIKPMPGEPVVNKTTISAFWSSGIDILLRAFGTKYILFVGVSTNMCVEGTARDAADKGYSCVLIEDALATTHETLHWSTLINYQRFYGRVSSTTDIIDELNKNILKA